MVMGTGTAQFSPEEIQQGVRMSWERGVLNYRRRNTQKYLKVKTEQARLTGHKVYWEATRRLGKSSELLMMFTEHCLQTPGWRAGFFAPVKDGLLDYIQPIIEKTLADCPTELYPVFNKSRFTLEFRNGSQIIFRGSNNQQHRVRRGQEFHEVGVDEGRDVDSLDVLIDSVLMPALFDNAGYLYISSTPADTRNHPLFRYREQAALGGWLVRIPIWDASRLDPTAYPEDRIREWRKETLSSLDGDTKWRREFECEWVVDASRMIVPEWRDAYEQAPKPDPLFQYWDKYLSLDIGTLHKTVALLAYYNWREACLYVVDEIMFQGRGWNTQTLATAIREKETEHWGQNYKVYRRVGDCNNPILLADLTTLHALPIHATTKTSLINQGEDLGMVNEMRLWVNKGRVKVHPRCRLLVETLRNGVWNKDKEDFEVSDALGHMDAIASLMYLVRNIDQQHNPVPATVNYNPSEQYWQPQVRRSEGANNIERVYITDNPFNQMGKE